MKTHFKLSVLMAALLPLLTPFGAQAQLVISDTLSGVKSDLDWKALTGACLTAGNNTGTVPACVGLPYYTGKTLVGGTGGRLPDATGQGALRLTNGDWQAGTNGNNQTGAVVSNFTFPSNSGVQVTFETRTYGGNAYKNADGKLSGADGIAFFLMDGAVAPNVGGNGGSIGYTCSNGNGVYEGVTGGYVGLGIDEYGNFTNPGDTTATGPGQKPGSISLRGGGSIAWAALNAKYQSNYPSTLTTAERESAVKNTCKTGLVQDWSGAGTKNNPKDKGSTSTKILDYPILATKQLDSTKEPLYNQESTDQPKRGNSIRVTYNLSITQDGLLSFMYSYNGGPYQPVLTDKSIIADNGPLPATFRFGFTSGTGGGSNVHEITCFKAAQISDTAGSAGGNGQQGTRVQAGSQIFVPLFHPTNWWGQLTAQNILVDNNDVVSIDPVANWDASCVLTGGACSATKGTNTAQSPLGTQATARQILSWNGSAGVPFRYSNLSAAQQTAIGDSDRVNYLRGDRSNELTTSGGGKYRVRKGVLGDVVNSSPTWVGNPQAGYKSPWRDALNKSVTITENASGATKYEAFSLSAAKRANVVYVGANDGMLHGFRAGSFKDDSTFDASTNDGSELLAYVPAAVVSSIHSTTTSALDYSSTQYAHNAYVDSTPGTGDVFWGTSWKTVLVGGLGAGGNAGGVVGKVDDTANGVIYALNVTDPSAFTESTASSTVLGEWSTSTLTCGEKAAPFCGRHLGSVTSAPVIVRLHDGNWAAIFGNGLNSSSGTAGIYIMSFNSTSGAISFRFLDTGRGPTGGSTAKNGIANISAADFDGDSITDYVYAGDLYGNLWRFDLTSATATDWAVGSTPLIATNKPITVAPVVGAVNAPAGNARMMVGFGTGRKINQTLTSAETYTTGQQSIYGVWDWDMSSWNGKSVIKYAVLSSPQTVADSALTGFTLQDYAVTNGAISGYRAVVYKTVCWKGSTVCPVAADNKMYGWKLDLPLNKDNKDQNGTLPNEQIVFDPVLAAGNIVVNTLVPSVDQGISCTIPPASGFTMSLALEGAVQTKSPFATATNNYVPKDGGVVAGIGLSGTGTPFFVVAGKKRKPTLITNSTQNGGQPIPEPYDKTEDAKAQRLTWVKLR